MTTTVPSKSPRPVRYISIPANTPAVQCHGCPQIIYFIETGRGTRMPVSVDVDGAIVPTADEPGRGISHFATCPAAAAFRNRRR